MKQGKCKIISEAVNEKKDRYYSEEEHLLLVNIPQQY
jgi:hypothetical protein